MIHTLLRLHYKYPRHYFALQEELLVVHSKVISYESVKRNYVLTDFFASTIHRRLSQTVTHNTYLGNCK